MIINKQARNENSYFFFFSSHFLFLKGRTNGIYPASKVFFSFETKYAKKGINQKTKVKRGVEKDQDHNRLGATPES